MWNNRSRWPIVIQLSRRFVSSMFDGDFVITEKVEAPRNKGVPTEIRQQFKKPWEQSKKPKHNRKKGKR